MENHFVLKPSCERNEMMESNMDWDGTWKYRRSLSSENCIPSKKRQPPKSGNMATNSSNVRGKNVAITKANNVMYTRSSYLDKFRK